MEPHVVASWHELADRRPHHALVADVDLVVVRADEEVTVLSGRCLHRGALMADGRIEGDDLVCGLHGWDYRFRTGVSAYTNGERLQRFTSWAEGGSVFVDADEIRSWAREHPQPYDRGAYLGAYQDPHGAPQEPFIDQIHELARRGLDGVGQHGPVAAMGVPRDLLPS